MSPKRTTNIKDGPHRREVATLEPAFGHWLAGFTDGEACFEITKSPTQAGKDLYRCGFTIKLRADDAAILEDCRSITGVGGVSYVYRRDNGTHDVVWKVQTREECHVLADIFTSFPLQTKKRFDLEIWQEALAEWDRLIDRNRPVHGQEAKPEVLEQMKTLRQELREGRRYQEPELPPERGPTLVERVREYVQLNGPCGGPEIYEHLQCDLEVTLRQTTKTLAYLTDRDVLERVARGVYRYRC